MRVELASSIASTDRRSALDRSAGEKGPMEQGRGGAHRPMARLQLGRGTAPHTGPGRFCPSALEGKGGDACSRRRRQDDQAAYAGDLTFLPAAFALDDMSCQSFRQQQGSSSGSTAFERRPIQSNAKQSPKSPRPTSESGVGSLEAGVAAPHGRGRGRGHCQARELRPRGRRGRAAIPRPDGPTVP